jgi:hypothetical protein
MARADYIFIFNESFDRNMMNIETLIRRKTYSYLQENKNRIRCLMMVMTGRCKLANPFGTDYKWPTLDEAYQFVFGVPRTGAHNAIVDARDTGLIALELQRRGDWDFRNLT